MPRRESEPKGANPVSVLRDLARSLLACVSLPEVWRASARSLQSLIDVQSVLVFYPHQDVPGSLAGYPIVSPYGDYIRSLQPGREEGLLGEAILVGKAILIEDTELHAAAPAVLGSERSAVVAPLILEPEEESAWGVLYVGAVAPRTLNVTHRDLIETVAHLSSLAVKNVQFLENSQKMSLTDPMTGLSHYRLFQLKLGEEMEYADRHNRPLTLAILGIDQFKDYADIAGLTACSEALREIASLLEETSARAAARHREFEFILLFTAGKEDAAREAERIRLNVQQRFAGHSPPLTVSLGLAGYPMDAVAKDSLLHAAHQALGEARRGGRNRVSLGG